ncbi:sulfatase-like hydrolase/transferase [Leucobacter sp. gxy201]|uniref:sulfatase-like hydrolase/transferase n=1 Tax=Leucobacter sp. gxy201 TaxID=2957200 RepID=UPI003D9FE87A
MVFWLLLVLGAVFVGAAIWIRRTFGPITVDQMIMNLVGGGEGVPSGYIETFIWQAIVIPIALLVVAALLVRFVTRRITGPRAAHTHPELPSARGVSRWRGAVKPLVAIVAFSTGLAVFVQVVGLDTFIRSIVTSVTMEKYYVVPDAEQTYRNAVQREDKPKNLVMIFLESGEESFSDPSLFGRNLNESLEEATADWQKFDRLETYEGGGWTMAGVVGTECGVPLRGAGIFATAGSPNDIGTDSDGYMPGAVCIGDVLDDAGYRSVFLGGADASFASKKDFLKTHGYDEVLDYNDWHEMGETQMSPWGLSDGRLMEQAKAEVTRLHDSGEPFNLTALTVDPHAPAFIHEYCPTDSDDETEKMAAATECSLQQVAGFVDYMREMGYLEDTVVFITGDHPKMTGEGEPFYEEMRGLTDRPLFNRLWNPDATEIERTSIDQLSVYATLLDVLGLGRSDHRAGVGVSALVSPDGFDDDKSAITSLTRDEYSEVITSRSPGLYEKLWDESGANTSEAADR